MNIKKYAKKFVKTGEFESYVEDTFMQGTLDVEHILDCIEEQAESEKLKLEGWDEFEPYVFFDQEFRKILSKGIKA